MQATFPISAQPPLKPLADTVHHTHILTHASFSYSVFPSADLTSTPIRMSNAPPSTCPSFKPI